MNFRSWSMLSVAFVAACGPGEITDEDGAKANAGYTDVSEAVTSPRCPNGATVRGIDVSIYQHSVNWTAVKGSGVEFAIARVSDGLGSPSSPYDSTFVTNWNGMKAAGLIRGAYQYFEPGEDPTAQANMVIAKVGHLGTGDLPVMLDVEATGGQSAATITARIHTWVNAITAGTGKKPFIYTGAYFWDGSVKSADFAGLALDVAWYGTTCPGMPSEWSNWTFHQYTDAEVVPGVSGGVDGDVFNGTLAQLQAYAGVEAGPPPPPPTAPACGAMKSGAELARGGEVHSCNGNAFLAHQTDGNLVLYDSHAGKALWSSGTAGQATSIFAMQTDGNAVLYGSKALWFSATAGNPGAILEVQDDGNMVVYGAGFRALWQSGTKIAPIAPPCGTLKPGASLAKGQAVHSCDGRFQFVHQGDGNVVLYEGGTALWSSRTAGRATTSLVMQGDGNLVLYNGGSAVWFSATGGHSGAFLAMQNDGNAVIYGSSGAIWFTATGGR